MPDMKNVKNKNNKHIHITRENTFQLILAYFWAVSHHIFIIEHCATWVQLLQQALVISAFYLNTPIKYF